MHTVSVSVIIQLFQSSLQADLQEEQQSDSLESPDRRFVKVGG